MAKKELKFTLFWTKSCNTDQRSRNQDVHTPLTRKAKTLLKEHGFDLRLNPTAKQSEFILPTEDEFTEYPENESEQHAGKLRNLANQVYPGNKNHRAGLVVIYCPFKDVQGQYAKEPTRTGGITFGWNKTYTQQKPVDGINWPPFVVINARILYPDAGTLVHEACHAAGIAHHSDQKNIMSYGNNRTEINDEQQKKLAKAYFVGTGA